MASGDRPAGPAGYELGSGLPRMAGEFRLELLRRLQLLEREVEALLSAASPRPSSSSVATLRSLEKELRVRLAADLDSANWVDTRAGIISLWRQHRQAFERLATECRQRYEARPGRRNLGPRW